MIESTDWTSSVYTRDLDTAFKLVRALKFGETYINRENFEAMQGFHAGWRKSGIGGADGSSQFFFDLNNTSISSVTSSLSCVF